MRNSITFFVNGKKHDLSDSSVQMMLADYLRQVSGLTGTKIVCAEGDCGACTVLRYSQRLARGSKSPAPELIPINACITRVAQMHGSSIVTVEGVTPSGGLSPVQKAMVGCHGSQCGFCTPGFVMALSGLVEKKLGCAKLEPQEVKNSLTGNLCRCTGYQPIIDAAVSIPMKQCRSLAPFYLPAGQLKELKKIVGQSVVIQSKEFEFYAPTTVSEACRLLKKNPKTRLIAGGTDLGVLQNKRKLMLSQLMSLHLIGELFECREIKKGKVARARIGANINLTELRAFCQKKAPEFARFLDLFASPQIKNVATLAGNVGNASPIAETPPFLLVANTTVHVAGSRGRRSIPLEKFFLAYRKTALKPGEFIVSLEFDLQKTHEELRLYKVSQRKDLDISAVNAAFRLKFKDPRRGKVESIKIAMGGVAATPLRLLKTESYLLKQPLSQSTIEHAVKIMHSEMTPLSDLRGSQAFRRVVSENLFRRFFKSISGDLA